MVWQHVRSRSAITTTATACMGLLAAHARDEFRMQTCVWQHVYLIYRSGCHVDCAVLLQNVCQWRHCGHENFVLPRQS